MTMDTHAPSAVGKGIRELCREFKLPTLAEVLFTLIAERYECRSLGITSNLVFSEWEKVFANSMATAAALDMIVHHSVMLEFDVPSFRTNTAQGGK